MTTFNHSIDLRDLSNKNFYYLYFDQQGQVTFDQDNSFWGKVVRVITSLIGWRDYNLVHLLPAIERNLYEAPEYTQSFRAKNIVFLTEKLAHKVGLTYPQLSKIQTLSRYFFAKDRSDKEFAFTQKESAELGGFLEEVAGNEKFNEALNQCVALRVKTGQVHQQALLMLRTFSFKMKHREKFDKAYGKVVHIRDHLRDERMTTTLTDDQKLSHANVLLLESMAKMQPLAAELKKMGLTQDKRSLVGRMARQINGTDNFLKQVLNIIEKKSPHTAGSLIFYDLDNFAAKRSYIMNLLHTLAFRGVLKSDIFHASMGFRNKKGKDIEAHIWARFEMNRRTLSSRTFKTLSFDADKVFSDIPVDMQGKLESLYGNKWKKVMENKFQELLVKYFSDTKQFEELYNPALRRFLVGVGIQKSFSEYSLADRMKFSSWKQCVCSEFTMKALLQVYFELNAHVVADWQAHNKRQQEKRKPGLEGQPPVLPNPIDPFLRLHRIPPSKMVKSLVEGGYVKETPHPEILQQIMKYRVFDLSKSYDLPFSWQFNAQGTLSGLETY